MNEVEQIVYQRIKADNASGGVLDLLGDNLSAPTRFTHAFQNETPSAPGLVFYTFSAPVGQVPRFTRDVFIAFSIFADNSADIALRLIRLFDGVSHDLSLISGGAVQIGGLSSVFDFEGPDGFDESLEVQKKDMRFRFFSVGQSLSPI